MYLLSILSLMCSERSWRGRGRRGRRGRRRIRGRIWWGYSSELLLYWVVKFNCVRTVFESFFHPQLHILTLLVIFSCCQQKKKGTQGIIEIENPNLVKPKNIKAKNIDVSSAPLLSLVKIFYLFMYVRNSPFRLLYWQLEKTTELSRRERYVDALTLTFAYLLN